jgi:hypothetical protein
MEWRSTDDASGYGVFIGLAGRELVACRSMRLPGHRSANAIEVEILRYFEIAYPFNQRLTHQFLNGISVSETSAWMLSFSNKELTAESASSRCGVGPHTTSVMIDSLPAFIGNA